MSTDGSGNCVMRSSVTAIDGQVPEQSLALPLLGAARSGQVAGNSLADGLWILPIVGRAIDRCMSRKEAALLLGISEGALSKQIAGADGKCMNFARFGALGERVAVALADELRSHFKLDDPQERVQQAMELIGRGMAQLVAEAKR